MMSLSVLPLRAFFLRRKPLKLPERVQPSPVAAEIGGAWHVSRRRTRRRCWHEWDRCRVSRRKSLSDLHLEFDRSAGFRVARWRARYGKAFGQAGCGPGRAYLGAEPGRRPGLGPRHSGAGVRAAGGGRVAAGGSRLGHRVADVLHDPPGPRGQPRPSPPAGPLIELRPGFRTSRPSSYGLGGQCPAGADDGFTPARWTAPNRRATRIAGGGGRLSRAYSWGALRAPDAVVITAASPPGPLPSGADAAPARRPRGRHREPRSRPITAWCCVPRA